MAGIFVQNPWIVYKDQMINGCGRRVAHPTSDGNDAQLQQLHHGLKAGDYDAD